MLLGVWQGAMQTGKEILDAHQAVYVATVVHP